MSTKRPGTMSDEERALAAMERRRKQTPALGVPVTEFDKDDHTPVSVLVERIQHEIGDELSPREQRIVDAVAHAFGRHTANVELRARQHRDTGDTGTLLRRVGELDDRLTRIDVDLRGDGNSEHGRIGTLEQFRSRLVKWALGSLLAIASAAISFGIWMGSVRTDLDNLKQQQRSYLRWLDFSSHKKDMQR